MTRRVGVGRVYEERGPDDGRRIIVDRLWPRGLRKDDARFDEWYRDAAPSTELRKWYGHEPARFEEFCRRYEHELATQSAAALAHLREQADQGPITLLTATKDVALSELVVLAAAVRGDG